MNPPMPDIELTTAVAQRHLLEALAALARSDDGLLPVIAAVLVVAEQWDEAEGDSMTGAFWKSISALAWTVQLDYRRSTMED